jgi:hypothetical protein
MVYNCIKRKNLRITKKWFLNYNIYALSLLNESTKVFNVARKHIQFQQSKSLYIFLLKMMNYY